MIVCLSKANTVLLDIIYVGIKGTCPNQTPQSGASKVAQIVLEILSICSWFTWLYIYCTFKDYET